MGNVFTNLVSGKNTQHPELELLLAIVRDRDLVEQRKPCSLCSQVMNALAVLSGKMDDALVERGEHQLIVNCQTEQAGICDLLVSVQSPE